jgi:hypothetical protein
MLNKHFGISNIKKYPLRKLADFLKFAYEREIYDTWLTLYPLMEANIMEYVSFEKYKQKLAENANTSAHSNRLSDEEIIEHGLKIAKAYEKQQKAGEKNRDI